MRGVEQYLKGIPCHRRHVLLDEAGVCCLDLGTSRHILLALGSVLAPPGASRKTLAVCLLLREETMAALWGAVCGETWQTFGRASWLHRLPASWGIPDDAEEPQEGDDEGEDGPGLYDVATARCDEVWDLRPTAAGAVIAGHGDGRVVRGMLVGLVGPEKHAVMLQGNYLWQLWRTMLAGPGGHFARKGTGYHRDFARLRKGADRG